MNTTQTTPATTGTTPATTAPISGSLSKTERAVLDAVTTYPGGITADIARAAGTARSTTGKALAALEKIGAARREPGGRDDKNRPAPDRWYPITPDTDRATEGADQRPTADGLDPQNVTTVHHGNPTDTSDGAVPDQDGSTGADEPRQTDAPKQGIDGHGDRAIPTTPQELAEPRAAAESANEDPAVNDTPDGLTAAADAASATETSGEAATERSAPATTDERGQHAAASQDGSLPPAPPAPGSAADGHARLQPGELRQMVAEHLKAHPQEAFTSTAISRVIGRSSGAIANALVTLTKQGHAQQVNERPRRYQLADGPTTSA